MTSQRTLNRLFTLHSWAGIVTGLLMFIVCFSGAVVVFKHEIDLWANPSLAQLPRSKHPASLDAVLTQLHTRYPGATVETIALPDAVNPSYFAFVRERGAPASTRTKVALRSDTGTVVGPVDSQLGQYLRRRERSQAIDCAIEGGRELPHLPVHGAVSEVRSQRRGRRAQTRDRCILGLGVLERSPRIGSRGSDQLVGP